MLGFGLTFILVFNVYLDITTSPDEITLQPKMIAVITVSYILGIILFIDYNKNYFIDSFKRIKDHLKSFLIEIILIIPFALLLIALTTQFEPKWFSIIILIVAFIMYFIAKEIQEQEN